jgi:hypothetical protein
VKKRYERRLLALEGVTGVGIGEDAGEPRIKVYVDEDRPARRASIPHVLEDIPVVVEESGAFEAY